MAKGIFSFNDLDKAMTKVDPLGSIITENEFSRISEWIPTGNYALNAQISGSIFKGIPANRGIVFAGESGTGKTFLILNAVREAQKLGYFVIYGDSETAVDQDLLEKFGIDPNKVRYQPFKTALDVRHFAANLCATLREKKKAGLELPKVMFVIDSLGNLATEKERADAQSGSDKRDMTKQQNLRSMFRVITTDLAEFKIPLLMSNHTYASIGGYIPMQIISGGGGAIYNASIILMLTKAGLKTADSADEEAADAGASKSGIIVTSKPYKNRFARPLPVKFHISFYKGMNRFVGLENYISWETCGIGKGTLVEEILETPIMEADGITPKMYRGKPKIERTKTGKFVYSPDPSAKTFAVKHLGRTVKGSQLFSPEVFTQEILELLDEQVIRPMFELPKVVQEDEELNEALGIDSSEDDEEALDAPTEIIDIPNPEQ
jgi:RecA/RadA recombinase